MRNEEGEELCLVGFLERNPSLDHHPSKAPPLLSDSRLSFWKAKKGRGRHKEAVGERFSSSSGICLHTRSR